MVARDAQGRVTARAVRVETPLEIDGRLDDAVYARVPAMTDFIRNDPDEGAPASERTEVWILFDDERVYLSARCRESRPERMRATEMRRDNTNIAQDDNLAWALDTFFDRRNAFLFEVNAVSGRMDAQTSNEGRTNFDWNPIWQVEAQHAGAAARPDAHREPGGGGEVDPPVPLPGIPGADERSNSATIRRSRSG